jgi:serine/threonine protein phosphatase PrpC
MNFSWQVGSETDIGGGRENQDDFLVFQQKDVIVMCIFDGHGREVGKTAANAARISVKQHCEECLQELIADPVNWLELVLLS